ncbi:MAG: hydantoinase/oxoprolinase family protein [Albidovulum sp.]|nr:hydantoinase/oxoprolinase family protein [Albidovulum sp.]MDE0308047.1 hydantoinase/oxoprolinase family protein [Albidovulum sp.]MDE0533833.1 hydantoinase/oxoprolinase family protein [Albidovulum sp.]
MIAWNLGIDVGGTFTDVVLTDESGERHTTKTPTTLDQSDGVLAGIEKVAQEAGATCDAVLANCGVIVHGTTVATNALLEYRGAKVGLLTTEGFRDELEFRRSYKESTFDPRLKAPHQICPRSFRLGIPERLTKTGEVLIPLDEDAVRNAVLRFREAGTESIAVCYLFSFVDPSHERRTSEIIREMAPETFISLSCDVLPEVREYERVSTTVVNAYVGPLIQRYVSHLEIKLRDRGFKGELFIMQSNGGMSTAAESGRHAVGTLLSGPAGGVTAAGWLGGLSGYKDLMIVDMGGTSCDIAVIRDLAPQTTTQSWVARYRIALPMLDIHTVGAGGGSVAWIDDGGALRVGPESAGSIPGPACYGRGGTRPTTTDANLILGLLNADYFLGGEMKLDLEAARRAVKSHVADALGLHVEEAAQAISEIINNNMANASHLVTTRRGLDPSGLALVAAGGAGALHAGRQAELLGMSTIIVPAAAPVFCALGDTVAHLKVNDARTYLTSVQDLDLTELNRLFAEMEARARERLGGQNVTSSFETRRSLDLRYVGEVHEVTIPLRTRTRRVTALNIEATLRSFHDAHEQLYSHKDPSHPVELLTVRIEYFGLRKAPREKGAEFGDEDPSQAIKGKRAITFADGRHETAVYAGEALRAGHFIHGPAAVESWGTTIMICPGQEALIDAFGNCIIENGRSA